MDKAKGQPIKDFLYWAVNDGQKYASELSYAPLPSSLVDKVVIKINSIEIN